MMANWLDAALIFGFLAFFHFWGGAAVGAGGRGRKIVPVLWGVLIGGAPFYFGIERGSQLGEWGWLAFQSVVTVGSALLVANGLPRLRALFLTQGMSTLAAGTFIMCAAAVVGAWFFRQEAEAASLIVGGLGFLFGAMWFGAGIKQLRGK